MCWAVSQMVAKGVGRQEIRMDMGGMKEYGVGTLSLDYLSWCTHKCFCRDNA